MILTAKSLYMLVKQLDENPVFLKSLNFVKIFKFVFVVLSVKINNY